MFGDLGTESKAAQHVWNFLFCFVLKTHVNFASDNVIGACLCSRKMLFTPRL